MEKKKWFPIMMFLWASIVSMFTGYGAFLFYYELHYGVMASIAMGCFFSGMIGFMLSNMITFIRKHDKELR